MKAQGLAGWLRSLLLSVAALGAVACGGGGGDALSPSVGLWTGTHRASVSIDFFPYQLAVFPGGTARIREGTGFAQTAFGGWTEDAGTLVVSYTPEGSATNHNFAGVLDGDHLAGTYGTGSAMDGAGVFSLDRDTAAPSGIWRYTEESGQATYFVFYPDQAVELIVTASTGHQPPVAGASGTWDLAGTVLTATFDTPGTLVLHGVLHGDAMDVSLTSGGTETPVATITRLH